MKFKLRLGKFERQFSTSNDNNYGEWSGFIMVGKEFNKLWFATKGSAQHGEVNSTESRLFYTRTISPHIGIQLGWKRDTRPDPERDWLSVGLLGVLPGKIGADVSLFVGESGRQALRLEVAYKYWFGHNLSLTPGLEVIFIMKMILKEVLVRVCRISTLACAYAITSPKAYYHTRV